MVWNWVIARLAITIMTMLSTTEELTASATPRGPPRAPPGGGPPARDHGVVVDSVTVSVLL